MQLEAEDGIQEFDVVEVPVDGLRPADSPRLDGQDERYVGVLAEVAEPLPPLLVHRTSGRVIDGMHRLAAARLRGAETVRVRYHDCDDTTAFILAVQANVRHGLPLTLADRKAAAARILVSHPAWSDRRVAAVVGLADKTVAAVRVGAGIEDTGARVGRDGRLRPVGAAGRRAAVARLVKENPERSLRQIAREAGVSPETVRAVRSDLVPRRPVLSPRAARRENRPPRTDALARLRMLLRDPAFRSTDSGRVLLRALSTLQVIAADDGGGLVGSVPDHVLALFQDVAQAQAEVWRGLADQAARRERDLAALRRAAA